MCPERRRATCRDPRSRAGQCRSQSRNASVSSDHPFKSFRRSPPWLPWPLATFRP
ncbi:hypothetical protein CcrRB23_gp500 [Caulobacter phage RB23]|nr:hypothetical protein CcrRB23_gp500 [Caulobacter phage RB23]